VAAEEEREESKHVEQEGDHRAEILSGSAPTDQRLAAGRGFGEGQGDTRMTVGRDEPVMVGVELIQRDVAGVAGMRQSLQENLELVQRYAEEFYERAKDAGWLERTPAGTTVTEVITPEMQRMRDALRPTPAAIVPANSGGGSRAEDADWSPFDYGRGGSR
jgi:hypothetical protein